MRFAATEAWRTTTRKRIVCTCLPRACSLRKPAKQLRVTYVETSEGDDRRSRDVGHLPNAFQGLGRHRAVQ